MSDNVIGGRDLTSPAALKIAVVGPSHPYKGGVASHTTTLAHELADAGHDVTLVSWSHLYPSLIYPGEQAVPGGAPDVEPFPRTIRALSWARPDTWIRTGRRLADMDAIIVVHVIPPVIPAHLALLRAAGAARTNATGIGPRTIVIAHNVLPHEARPGDAERARTVSIELYRRGAEWAAERGIIIADTKFELGLVNGELVLADEVLTPDSSRFWPADQWEPGHPQPSFDKQFVREWLTSPASGWSKSSSEAPPALPEDVVAQTRAKYVEAYERLTGETF